MERSGDEKVTESRVSARTAHLGEVVVNRLSRPGHQGDGPGSRATSPCPVLLIHGWPQDCRMWLPVIDRIPTSRRVEVPDLRGFGNSSAPGHGYDAETFAADQIALMDSLGIDTAHIVGHDWGGWTAFLLALRYPQRIASITVINAPHPWPRLWPPPLLQVPRSWYAMLLSMPAIGPSLLRSGVLTRRMLDWGSNRAMETESVGRYVDSFTDHRRATASSRLYRYYLRAFFDVGRAKWRDQHLNVPAQLLFGAKDRMIDRALVESGFYENGGRRLEVFPEHGHFLPDEAPAVVADRSVSFWSQVESAGAVDQVPDQVHRGED